MLDAGVIREQEKFELIEGEIVVMSPKSIAHDDIQNALNLVLVRAVPERFSVGNGSSLQLGENILVEPDLAIISRELYKTDRRGFARPTAEDVLLVIEIAVASLTYDRETKARLTLGAASASTGSSMQTR